jgi:hypothetical protein
MKLRCYRAAGVGPDKVCNCGVRLVKIHSRFVGALDAIIFSSTVALKLVVLFVLFNPAADGGRVAHDPAINATTAVVASLA